ncbi:MAG: ExeM/NucH family extracellular endonuclease, partial [Actinomycetota bacterium]|nr:ExeM/NucH family extracellular endonuclease [Actinomycetota bacterium]
LGPDTCGPSGNLDCRGANSVAELDRQRAKTVAALAAMDADVVGLIELENNPSESLSDLVDGLNAVVGAGTYDFVDTGTIGTDAIKVGLIYKPAIVEAVNPYAILDSSVDSTFIDTKNRPVLIQTFEESVSGARFTVAVNHLKSKGSNCNSLGDPDLDDGQANCNLTRTSAATALVNYLVTDPTGSGDSDFLVIGDLNAYAMEDPVSAIKAAGYTDLLSSFGGAAAYSYVFDGQLGYLDHALANATLLSQVKGVTEWHINADEVNLFDYNDDIQDPAEQWYERESVALLIFEEDAYRSSDHDPVIVGLDLCEEIAPEFVELTATPSVLWPANHKYVRVTTTVVVDDNFDPDPTVELISVESNEPDNGRSDGNTINDIVIVDDFTFMLRAERSGLGEGRTYTITYKVTDDCGNEAIDTVEVFVPHNRRGGR